jgi:hypothetical protein
MNIFNLSFDGLHNTRRKVSSYQSNSCSVGNNLFFRRLNLFDVYNFAYFQFKKFQQNNTQPTRTNLRNQIM